MDDNFSVSGSTKLIGFAGYPTEQGRSPQLLTERFQRLEMDCVVVPVKAAPSQLALTLRAFASIENCLGCIVTIPHKRAALPLSAAASEQAKLTDLCNAIRWYPERGGFADQFDGAGFVSGVRQAGHEVTGRVVYLNGAGGAGRAIAFALAQAGVQRITVHDIDSRAEAELCRQLNALQGDGFARLAAGPEQCDSLVINASPVGMQAGDPLPIRLETVNPDAVLADVIMSPARTSWIDVGEQQGHPVVTGLSMLHGQFDALESFFTTAYRHAIGTTVRFE